MKLIGVETEADAFYRKRSPGNVSSPRLRWSWLGQAGFLIELEGKRILIDPYLSDSLFRKYRNTGFAHKRMMPPPVEPDALGELDLVCSTHAHTDHLDPDTLGPLFRTCVVDSAWFLCPQAVHAKARERGVPENSICTANAGDHFEVAGIGIDVLPSAHETLDVDDAGKHLYLGYLLSVGGVRIFHSGDCIPYAGLPERLSSLAPDVVLFPVNGRDESRRVRGIPGNFTIMEAAELYRASGASLLIPHHFGMFDFNSVSPEDIRDGFSLSGLVEGEDYLLPETGKVYNLT